MKSHLSAASFGVKRHGMENDDAPPPSAYDEYLADFVEVLKQSLGDAAAQAAHDQYLAAFMNGDADQASLWLRVWIALGL
jgi:hypothetical protein